MAVPEEVYSALVAACNHGDHVSLQTLLTNYPEADVNISTEGGVSLLMHTIIGAGTEANPGGHYLETCQLLIQYGISLETADLSNGRTAAHWATYYHRDDILSELIFAGSDMTTPDILGTSPFHLAIQEEAIDCLGVCLRFLPKEILELPDGQQRLPLPLAIATGSLDAIELLLRAGVDVSLAQEGSGFTALHVACQLGQGPVVELLLRNGAQLDVMDSSGLTPLHIAAVSESLEGGLTAIVRVVGSSVLDVRDQRGMTPLMQAAAYGSEHNLKFLLKKKVDVSTVDALEGKTALHWAAGSATPTSSSCVLALLKKQRSLLESKDSFGRTAVSCCAVSGLASTLATLVESGAVVTTADKDQRTPVHWATVSGNYDIITSLAEAGCSLDSADSAGATPIHYAVQHTAEPYPELLDPEEYEAALEVCRNVQACLVVLLEGGAKVGVVNSEGNTPLHNAVQYPNNVDAGSALLMRGADPLAVNAEGMTPFHVAALGGVVDACEMLLEHSGGIHGNDCDMSGRSAVVLAVMSGSVECVGKLCELGLDVNQTDLENRTPLHFAAQQGSLEMVQLLHSYSAELSIASNSGPHPSHEAAANGHADVLEYLILAGCPVNQVAGGSLATPLHYAVSSGHMTCIQVLMEHNADINALAGSEGDQATPLDYCPEGHAGLAELLVSLGAIHSSSEEEEEAGQEETTPTGDGESPPDQASVGDAVSIRSVKLSRPTTPTPKFEPPESDASVPVLPPVKANLIHRALTARPKQDPGSIVHSTVGLYTAHATLLAALMIGTPIGERAVEVAHKVATDTAQDLRRASAHSSTLPDLVWLRETTPTPPPPTPSPEAPPTPRPPTPPPVEIHIDPEERRLRKAIAQLDKTKSLGYLAVEELVRAQETHMRLKRQFQRDRLNQDLSNMRLEFQSSETRAREASNKVIQRLSDRMSKAEQQSEEMSAAIDEQLSVAREENNKLGELMGRMGVSPRPTVAQWIAGKDSAKRSALQSTLISWDRTRGERTTAILLQQTLSSQRALRHAAWGAKKDISERIRKLRAAYEPPLPGHKPRPPSHKPRPSLTLDKREMKSPKVKNKTPLRKSTTPTSSSASVRATPTGFFKVVTPPDHAPSQQLYSMGVHYIKEGRPASHARLRATGPKTVHAERSLHFLPPDEYKLSQQRQRVLSQQNPRVLSRHKKAQTSVVITDKSFKTRGARRTMSHDGAVYTSHGSQLPRQPASNQVPVLPMTVIEPTPV